MNRKKLIVLTGPTAVGKTALSIQLARKYDAEIISADSMQVYRTMDIGSAKVRPEEMCGIRHHLIDVLDPDEEFNVYRFKQLAKQALDDIYSRGKLPIVVGGTGFYIQALLYDIDFAEGEEIGEYRKYLEDHAMKGRAHELHEQLKDIDPKSYEEIHENNVKRVIRALEFYHDTHTPISEHNKEQREKESPYDFLYFVLTDQREKVYERIDRRVDLMMEEGLLDEIKALKAKGYTENMVSMQGLGYKEMLRYLAGEYDLEEALRIIKRDTRHFAKRQMTWFRREKTVTFVDKSEFENEEEILNYLTRSIDDLIKE